MDHSIVLTAAGLQPNSDGLQPKYEQVSLERLGSHRRVHVRLGGGAALLQPDSGEAEPHHEDGKTVEDLHPGKLTWNLKNTKL